MFQGFQDLSVEYHYAGLWTTQETPAAIERTAHACYRELGLKLDRVLWFDSPKYALYHISRHDGESTRAFLHQLCGLFLSLDVLTAGKRARQERWNEHPLLTYLDPHQASPWSTLREMAQPIHFEDFVLSLLNYLLIYQTMIQVHCHERELRPAKPFIELTRSCAFWVPLGKDLVIVAAPADLQWMGHGLHNDGGPAIQYCNGDAEWHLNGVRVSKEIAETPAHELDPTLLYTEQNAEIRREIVGKIGIERICSKLGAQCVDAQGDYELLLLDLRDGRKRPYLKMKNPSIGVYHLEGVSPRIRTVTAALNWRNGTRERPVRVT